LAASSATGFLGLTAGPALRAQIGKAFYNTMITESDYVGEDYEVFSSWLGVTE
jgi:hypothetical protein